MSSHVLKLFDPITALFRWLFTGEGVTLKVGPPDTAAALPIDWKHDPTRPHTVTIRVNDDGVIEGVGFPSALLAAGAEPREMATPDDAHPFPMPTATPMSPAQPTTKEVNPMAHLKITEQQANALRALRPIKTADKAGYKDARASLFNNIRMQLGIPSSIVLKVEVDDRASPQYLVLKGRPPKSKTVDYVPLDAGADGRFVDAVAAEKAAQWACIPLADAVALLREQGETMEGYKSVGTINLDDMATRIPSESRTELAIDVDDNLYFRIDG